MARKQGYVRGLRVAYDILRRARTYQSAQVEKTLEKDIYLRGQRDHTANCLHDLCLRIQEKIKKAKT